MKLSTATTWALGLPSDRAIQTYVLAWMLAFVCPPLFADTVYEKPEHFLQSTFDEQLKPSIIWLDKSLQADINQIMGHNYPQARLRYWRKNNTSVWILDEIGKEYPITAGFVINNNKIERAQVLVYRETRGMEIHLPGFLTQFKDNSMNGKQLANKVDGISGATLSVNAMVNMARVALLLNQKAQ